MDGRGIAAVILRIWETLPDRGAYDQVAGSLRTNVGARMFVISDAFQDTAPPDVAILSASGDFGSNGEGGDDGSQVVDPWLTEFGEAFIGVNIDSFYEGIWNSEGGGCDSGGATGSGIDLLTPGAFYPAMAETTPSSVVGAERGAGANSPAPLAQANVTAASIGVGCSTPTEQGTPQLIQSMSPGFTQTIYLTEDGSVWTMGCNTRGQLGDGAMGRGAWSSVPVSVDLPGPMKQVGSGTALCWALSADGRSAYAWGDNTKGQLGIGDTSIRYSELPVEIKFDLPPYVSIVSMASGLWCTLALLSNGEVMAWGDNQFGQCGQNPKIAGEYIDTPTVIPGLTGVTSLAAGDNYSMALKANGTVWAWGQNTNGEVGPNGPQPKKHSHTFVPEQVTGLPYIQKIVAGGKNGIALDASGHIWEWGRNEFGELGRGVVDPSDAAHPTPKMVDGLPRIVSVASQGPTVLAADAHGQVYAWGFDKWGAVGNGDTMNTGTPQIVLTLPTSPDVSEPSVQVAAAHRSSYAFNVVTGETYAWGENNYGQIGVPANESPNPFPINITDEIRPTLHSPANNRQLQHAESNVDGSHYDDVDGSRQVVRLLSGDAIVDYSTSTHFVFNPGVGQEEIYGFTESGQGHDVLNLPTSDVGILADILTNATYDGSGTILHFGHGDSIELIGVTKSELWAHPSDFAFHGPHKA